MTHSAAENLSPVLAGDGLCIDYGARRIVSDVSFSLSPGESVGLVGASGCGKSTIARALVGLLKLSAGRILWQGRNIAEFSRSERMQYRRSVQLVFQDTLGALNPRMRIGTMLEEVLSVHEAKRYPSAKERSSRVAELLDAVELSPDLVRRWPHELSGGQRQRIGIARALACGPSVLLADEPVSALDVAVQAQLLRLLHRLVSAQGLSLLFISHDLAVVRALCSRALVLHEGRVAEQGDVNTLFSSPASDITRALLDAVPQR